MLRLAPLLTVLAALLLAPAAGAEPSSWAQPQIKTVVARGLMAKTVASFRPSEPLLQPDLDALIGGLTDEPVLVGWTTTEVTMAVRALGLAPAAAQFTAAARAAGLKPSARFGTEVVARLLGLRANHPAAQDDLELLPNDTATRAEAAYSASRILSFSGSEVAAVQSAAATFSFPSLDALQLEVLGQALSFVGLPYVWGGTSEHTESPFGVTSRGGFDCSGFIWRVYKLQPYADAPGLGNTLRGRTTFQMSGEVPAAKRIKTAELQPGDILFFGAKGPRSKPAEIDHAGIYLGNGWFVIRRIRASRSRSSPAGITPSSLGADARSQRRPSGPSNKSLYRGMIPRSRSRRLRPSGVRTYAVGGARCCSGTVVSYFSSQRSR